jgi:hypothetical protein
MLSSSIYLLANDKISFFFMAEQNFIGYKYNIFLIHSSVVGHVGCFHNLAIVYSAESFHISVPISTSKNAMSFLLLFISTLQWNWRKAQNSFCLAGGRGEIVEVGQEEEKTQKKYVHVNK